MCAFGKKQPWKVNISFESPPSSFKLLYETNASGPGPPGLDVQIGMKILSMMLYNDTMDIPKNSLFIEFHMKYAFKSKIGL